MFLCDNCQKPVIPELTRFKTDYRHGDQVHAEGTILAKCKACGRVTVQRISTKLEYKSQIDSFHLTHF